MRIGWTDLALARVDEIAHHIAEDDRGAAVRWMVELLRGGRPAVGLPGEWTLGTPRVRSLIGALKGATVTEADYRRHPEEKFQ